MTHPLQRIKYGALSLLTVFVVAVTAYWWFGSYSLVDAVWMVVITISTVGFGEQTELDLVTKLITVGVILFGVSASVYTVGGFLQLLLEGEVERVLGFHRMNKEIAKLDNHVIICGCGRLGQDLVLHLEHRGLPFVVVEKSPEHLEELKFPVLTVIGDALLESTLEEAGVQRARALVAVLSNDADNVFITLTARNLNPKLQILAKCEHESTSNKLLQAGANKIVMPYRIGARKFERMISRPMTADLMTLFDEATQSEIELDEILVCSGNPLAGQTLRSSEIKTRFNLLVVGIKDVTGKLHFNPDAESRIGEGDTLLVIGPFQDVSALRKECG